MARRHLITILLLFLLFACSKTGEEYLSDADNFYKNKEYNKALPLYEKACSKGNLKSCMFLAGIYKKGKTVNIDNEKSWNFYKKSFTLAEKQCMEDNVYACKTLSNLYENGYGTNINLEKADFAAFKACNSGDAASCYKMARINADNIDDYILYADKACQNNLAYSCLSLGNTYLNGFNENMAEIKKDVEKGINYINKACEINSEMCENIANIYISGDDLAQNYQKALKYYETALKHYEKLCTEKDNNNIACRNIDTIKEKYMINGNTVF